ncbi:membrane bound O-acyl transferase MBOAT family protein [Kribbella flavida DSM 17836]|uniref:Membrane bound O-acyl transferase MBOAT family protein n=1 Tax=Kribbella flavida (strain DSM 17836 / JCM 10339 / NBRC 14399) TaxID=479435 RepID=D2PTQ8_KRIFD|nr:MBOAT family protein [Kribbella flavida]ADB31371.1 membrane bound O-acyl transferase MBOAT family protein [Kribbella flavida DSM 17836]
MSFAAPLFLWYFLPAVLLASWILPHRARNGVLAVFSLGFYAVGGKEFVLLLLALIAVNYAAGLAIGALPLRRRKAVVVATVLADLAVLAVWKYAGFASTAVSSIASSLGLGDTRVVSLALPIGISFFTFHHLSYVVDVYRGVRPPMRNPLTFVTYIAMFPQLVAGPIVRYHEIADQLNDARRDRLADFAEGFPRFAWGLFKKVAIADSLAPIADAAFASPDPSTSTAWIGALAYTGQIYFDFSGYSDMAIGLGMMFGLRLPENFARPYSAISVTDFWRRWHQSLSRWFRDYLYVPLGGNRGGTFRTYRNLSIVFLTTGLWHGAAWTFVIWGAFHGLLLIIERATGLGSSDRWAGPRRAITFLLVVFGWVLFRAESLPAAGRMLQAMVTPEGWSIAPDVAVLLSGHRILLLVLVLASTLLPATWVTGRVIDGLQDNTPVWARRSVRGIAVALAPYAGIVAVAGTFSPFLYFQF